MTTKELEAIRAAYHATVELLRGAKVELRELVAIREIAETILGLPVMVNGVAVPVGLRRQLQLACNVSRGLEVGANGDESEATREGTLLRAARNMFMSNRFSPSKIDALRVAVNAYAEVEHPTAQLVDDMLETTSRASDAQSCVAESEWGCEARRKLGVARGALDTAINELRAYLPEYGEAIPPLVEALNASAQPQPCPGEGPVDHVAPLRFRILELEAELAKLRSEAARPDAPRAAIEADGLGEAAPPEVMAARIAAARRKLAEVRGSAEAPLAVGDRVRWGDLPNHGTIDSLQTCAFVKWDEGGGTSEHDTVHLVRIRESVWQPGRCFDCSRLGGPCPAHERGQINQGGGEGPAERCGDAPSDQPSQPITSSTPAAVPEAGATSKDPACQSHSASPSLPSASSSRSSPTSSAESSPNAAYPWIAQYEHANPGWLAASPTGWTFSTNPRAAHVFANERAAVAAIDAWHRDNTDPQPLEGFFRAVLRTSTEAGRGSSATDRERAERIDRLGVVTQDDTMALIADVRRETVETCAKVLDEESAAWLQLVPAGRSQAEVLRLVADRLRATQLTSPAQGKS